MESIFWRSKSKRLNEFGVVQVGSVGLTELNKRDNVVFIQTSRHMEASESRYLTVAHMSNIAKSILYDNPTGAFNISAKGIDPDLAIWHILSGKLCTREEFKQVYFDLEVPNDSLDAVFSALERRHGDLKFIHVDVTEFPTT